MEAVEEPQMLFGSWEVVVVLLMVLKDFSLEFAIVDLPQVLFKTWQNDDGCSVCKSEGPMDPFVIKKELAVSVDFCFPHQACHF